MLPIIVYSADHTYSQYHRSNLWKFVPVYTFTVNTITVRRALFNIIHTQG